MRRFRKKSPEISAVQTAATALLLVGLAVWFLSGCGSSPADSDSWDEILKWQHRELVQSRESMERLASQLPERLVNLQKHLYILRSRFEKLMVYFDVSSGNPMVLRDTLGILNWFERQAQRLRQPFQQEKREVERLMKILKDLSLKFSREIQEVYPQSLDKGSIQSDLKHLLSLEAKLKPLSRKIDQGLESIDAFSRELAKDKVHVQYESDQVLKALLLTHTAPFFSAQAWHMAFEGVEKWVARFGVYIFEPVDMKGWGWGMFLFKVALFSLCTLCICEILLKRIGKCCEGIFHDIRWFPFLVCISVSAGALVVILSTGLFPSSFFCTVVTVILVYGFIFLSRNLRRFLSSEPVPHSYGLIPLWGAVSVVAVMESLHLPEETFIPIWSFWLLILWAHFVSHKARGQQFDKIFRTVLIVSLPVLFFIAFLGWGYLSVILGMLFHLVSLNLRLARSFSAILGRVGLRPNELAQRTAGSTVTSVQHLGFPIILLTLLLLSLAWIFVFVGGGSLFIEVIRYRVGWENFTFSVYRILCIFSLLFVVRAGIALTRKGIAGLPKRRPDLDEGSVQSMETIVTYVLWSLFVLISLGVLGISFRNLAVIAGGLSVGLGFGLQNIVNNFIGGLILLFGRSLQPGDLVEIDDVRGHVTKVTIRNTLVKTFSGSTIFVPNSLLISQKMINYSHADRRYRQEIKVGVAYGSDVEKVTELLLDAARQSAKVLDRPPPRVRFLDFGDNTLVFSLRLWIKGWSDRYADSEVRYHIDRIFRENHIEISFPQLDLHIRSAEGLKGRPESDPKKT